MKKYKLIIAPSSDDEKLFEGAETFSDALQVISNNPDAISSEYSFNTKEERDLFLQGYYAGIGYLGEGLAWTTEEGNDEQETPIETPWEFVGKYYPKYHQSDTIAMADDLQKLLDEEQEDGDCSSRILNEWYDGDIDNPKIQIDYDRIHKEIYEDAIQGYINSLKK